MTIEQRKSILWGLIPIGVRTVEPEFKTDFEETNEYAEGPEFVSYSVRVTSPDSLEFTGGSTHAGSFTKTLYKDEINQEKVQLPTSGVGTLIGYQEIYHWKPTPENVTGSLPS